jgi:hypothetical protein
MKIVFMPKSENLFLMFIDDVELLLFSSDALLRKIK